MALLLTWPLVLHLTVALPLPNLSFLFVSLVYSFSSIWSGGISSDRIKLSCMVGCSAVGMRGEVPIDTVVAILFGGVSWSCGIGEMLPKSSTWSSWLSWWQGLECTIGEPCFGGLPLFVLGLRPFWVTWRQTGQSSGSIVASHSWSPQSCWVRAAICLTSLYFVEWMEAFLMLPMRLWQAWHIWVGKYVLSFSSDPIAIP